MNDIRNILNILEDISCEKKVEEDNDVKKDDSNNTKMRSSDFEKRAHELNDMIRQAHGSGNKERAEKLKKEYDELHDNAKKGLLPENSEIRQILDFIDEDVASPEVGDSIDLEFGDTLIESVIEEIRDDGIVITIDDTGLNLILEEAQQRKNPFIYETNRKIDCVIKNKFPELPSHNIFSNRLNEGTEDYNSWNTFKKQLKDYKFNYVNIKEDDGINKLPKINKLIQEEYSDKKSNIYSELKKLADGSISPDKLKTGETYDVLVMFVDKASKTIDLNIHPRETIKRVKKIQSSNEYEVITNNGLRGRAAKDFVDDVEVLYFNDMNKLNSKITWFKVKHGNDIDEWKVSINTPQSFKESLSEAEYRGRKVPLGKKMRGDVKKFKVYVKGPKGNVVKVNFGDPNMRIKKSNPKRRKSFRARHNCANPGPRWKARYWSCRAW